MVVACEIEVPQLSDAGYAPPPVDNAEFSNLFFDVTTNKQAIWVGMVKIVLHAAKGVRARQAADLEEFKGDALTYAMSMLGKYEPTRRTAAAYFYTMVRRRMISLAQQSQPALLGDSDGSISFDGLYQYDAIDPTALGRSCSPNNWRCYRVQDPTARDLIEKYLRVTAERARDQMGSTNSTGERAAIVVIYETLKQTFRALLGFELGDSLIIKKAVRESSSVITENQRLQQQVDALKQQLASAPPAPIVSPIPPVPTPPNIAKRPARMRLTTSPPPATPTPRPKPTTRVQPVEMDPATAEAIRKLRESRNHETPPHPMFLFASLCVEMQRAAGDSPFSLSYRKANTLLGFTSDAAATRYLQRLVDKGMLDQVEKAGPNTTNRWRWKGGTPEAAAPAPRQPKPPAPRKIPAEVRHALERTEQMASLCAELQRQAGQEPFTLTTRAASRMLGDKDKGRTGARYLGKLVADGRLCRIPGSGRQASCRWIWRGEAAVQTISPGNSQGGD